MKLATLKNNTRDGQLVVVSRNLEKAVAVADIAITLQIALDNWQEISPKLAQVYQALNNGEITNAISFEQSQCESPLPRAYQWADGSAYVNHVELVRKARNAEMPETFWTDPLMYQGGSDAFIGPRDDIHVASEGYGIDFESEVAVITDDVPMGASPERAADHIKLLMLVNDVSLRNLIPGELAKGFGFFSSKPSSAFSPVAITPDELGAAWDKVEAKQVDFDLKYDPNKINQRNRYAVRAEIYENGKLRFTSTKTYSVITNGNPQMVDIIVDLVK